MNRYGHSYTEECDNKCGYATEIKEYKDVVNNAVIFPQTIGDITFYSKDELFEWVENMQKEFCSPPTGFLGREIEKPVKIVLEGEVTE
jgi:hypothetical protein